VVRAGVGEPITVGRPAPEMPSLQAGLGVHRRTGAEPGTLDLAVLDRDGFVVRTLAKDHLSTPGRISFGKIIAPRIGAGEDVAAQIDAGVASAYNERLWSNTPPSGS